MTTCPLRQIADDDIHVVGHGSKSIAESRIPFAML